MFVLYIRFDSLLEMPLAQISMTHIFAISLFPQTIVVKAFGEVHPLSSYNPCFIAPHPRSLSSLDILETLEQSTTKANLCVKR